MMRSKTFKSNKLGVAKRSRHQCGDAFDYNIDSPITVVVHEDSGGHTLFRTYLKCASQDGTMGVLRTVTDYRGKKVKAHLYDFTEAAGSLGWTRIPAHKGWTKTGKNFSKNGVLALREYGGQKLAGCNGILVSIDERVHIPRFIVGSSSRQSFGSEECSSNPKYYQHAVACAVTTSNTVNNRQVRILWGEIISKALEINSSGLFSLPRRV